MKNTLLFLIFIFSTFSYSQEDRFGGTPVKGIIPITRTNPKNISNLSDKTSSQTGIIPAVGQPTGNSSEVGVTEGQLSVSLSGAANYSIPIAVPPGINGVVPQLSLTYDSQSGNGQAGYGWNISGISSIKRIPSTKYHDNIIDPADTDNLDRFALDGQRLVVKTGTTGVYGAIGTIYELENYSNIKITSFVDNVSLQYTYGGNGFLVEYPDGSKAKYSLKWSQNYNIDYWENAQGIRINYDYELTGIDSLKISSISYGNSNQNRIDFIYKNRLRNETGFTATSQNSSEFKILSEIKVTGNSVAFRNYVLNYDATALGYERLISITEKSGDNSKSYNPTVFTYDTTPETITYNPIQTNVNISNISFRNSNSISGDFDGDGKMDFIMYPTTGSDAKQKYWLFKGINTGSTNIGFQDNIGAFEEIFPISWLGGSASYGYKLMPQQGWCVVKNNITTNKTSFSNYSLGFTNPILVQDLKEYIFPKFNINTADLDYSGTNQKYLKTIGKKYINGDFNGDGISDVLVFEYNTTFTMGLGYGLKTTSTSIVDPGPGGGGTQYEYIGQSYLVNLDKRLTANFVTGAGQLNINASSVLIVDDVDGDGKSDVLVFNGNTVKVYNLNDSNQLQLLWTTTNGNINTSLPILMGDYNGDGKSDFIIPKGYGNNYAKFISNGVSFKIYDVTYDIPFSPNSGTNANPNANYIIPTDFDHDGKTDLILAQNVTFISIPSLPLVNLAPTGQGYISVNNYKNTGNNFVNSSSTSSNWQSIIGSYAVPFFLNTNKQNAEAEINFMTNSSIIHFNSTKDFSKDKLLRSITIGNGVKNVISYSSLKNIDQSINEDYRYYPSTTTENYPNYDIKVAPSLTIVSTLENVSQTTYRKQDYRYYGAVTNVEGIGFLGFRGIAKTNWYNENTPIISTISKYDVSKRGALSETFTIAGQVFGNFTNFSPTSFINKTNLTYVDQVLPNKVYKIQNTFKVNYDGLAGTSNETTTTFDAYNNPETVSSITKNGATVDQTQTSVITYDNNNVVGSTYYIGRTNKKISSVTHNGDTMTSEEQFAYNPVQLLSQVKKKGHLTNFITEDYLYDTFGNVSKKTTSVVGGLAPRETNFVFDPTGRFLMTSKNVEGQETTYTYNQSTGYLLTKTLPSNPGFPLTTTFEYDVWGKTKIIINYLGKKNYTNYFTETNGYSNIVNTGDDGSYSKTNYDDLGRVYKTSVKNIDGTHSTQSTLYDIYNRKISVSEPYNGLSETPTLFNTSSYDLYGRPIESLECTGKTTTISYTGLDTTVFDGVKTILTKKNSLGYTKSSTDDGGTINYEYFANGNLKKSIYGATTIEMEQDGWGQKTKLKDPSAGEYRYEYNAFGETKKEITPKGETTYDINPVGKVNWKTIVGTGGDTTNSKSTYTYNATTKLLEFTKFEDFTGGYYENYGSYYDNYKRLNFSDQSGFLAYYQRATSYDAFGRPEKELYTAVNTANMKTSSKWIRNTYKNGYHWQILDDASSQMLWQTNVTNARGQMTNGSFGNGIIASNSFNQFGYLTKIKHDVATNGVNVMTLNTNFDVQRENLLDRYNSLFDYKDVYTYDSLDRLTSMSETGDLIGNYKFNTTSTEGFQSVGNASLSLTNGGLLTTATTNNSGVEKQIITNAPLGRAVNIKGFLSTYSTSVGTTLNVVIYEKDPISQSILSTTSIPILNGNFSYAKIISNANSNVFLKFQISNASQANMAFHISNVIVTLEKLNTQTYKPDGRIEQNNLGQYNYTITAPTFPVTKIYQNSSITPTAEATALFAGRNDLEIKYNVFKSPINIIEEGRDKLNFEYNSNNMRTTMYYGSLEADRYLRKFRKHYSVDGSMEMRHNTQTGEVDFVTYIGGDGYTAPVVLKSNGVTQQYLYLHRDYQGSILAITNQAGAVVEKRLFDAWGNIERVQDGSGATLAGLTILDRGYTGHEHLQDIGLINMNGRLYDPLVHRFLQPDNNLQDPSNTQNYNRYAYVMNNPLKYTDYSGEAYTGGPGKEPGGLSNGEQSAFGNAIATIGRNWDNWGIKNWSNKNIGLNQFSQGVKDAGNFVGRNIQSVGDFIQRNIESIFGGGKKEPISLPTTPSFSNYMLSDGWQKEGFGFVKGDHKMSPETAFYQYHRYNISIRNINKSFYERLTSVDNGYYNLPDPNMQADSGALGFICGEGELKFIQYSGEMLNTLKSTEIGVQSEEAVSKFVEMFKNNDLSVYTKPIYTYMYKGERFILDGHHRIEAARRLGVAIEAIELSGLKGYNLFASKVAEIFKGLHF